MIHRGEIVKKAVRRSGYSLTTLAEKLGVTRGTLYNKFKKADLDYWFIIQVGTIIHYDFTLDFPEVKEQPDLIGGGIILGNTNQSTELSSMEGKYVSLLERYTQLLEKLVKMANEQESPSLRQKIQKLLEMDT